MMELNRYVAFLRGINISGKNKISMAELKQGFEELGYSEVKTYLNSGNVLFSVEDGDIDELQHIIQKMILDKFGLEIPVYVISRDYLAKIIENAPLWWLDEDKDKYHNLIFVISPYKADGICHEIGEPSEGLEQIQIYDNVIFWTFDRKSYNKCNWWKKTAATGIAEKLTIRTANTVRKIKKIREENLLGK